MVILSSIREGKHLRRQEVRDSGAHALLVLDTVGACVSDVLGPADAEVVQPGSST